MKTNKDTQKTRRVVPIIDAECPICFENLRSSKDIVTTNCNHIFHKDCLDSWLIYSNTCPCCRFQLRVQQLKPLIPGLSIQQFHLIYVELLQQRRLEEQRQLEEEREQEILDRSNHCLYRMFCMK